MTASFLAIQLLKLFQIYKLQNYKIIKTHDTILKSIPNVWKKEQRAINPVNVYRLPSMTISLDVNEFSNKTSINLICSSLKCLLNHRFPTLYRVINQLHSVDYYGWARYRTARSCHVARYRTAHSYHVAKFHLWATCPKLVNFQSDLNSILHNVHLTDKQSTIIDYEELII